MWGLLAYETAKWTLLDCLAYRYLLKSAGHLLEACGNPYVSTGKQVNDLAISSSGSCIKTV